MIYTQNCLKRYKHLFVRSIERLVYPPLKNSDGSLFCSKKAESDNSPPTRGVLIPHILRVNYMSQIHKSYNDLKNWAQVSFDGWTKDATDQSQFTPLLNTKTNAPEDVLQLVSYGCKTGCQFLSCSCLKKTLPCTHLCGCDLHNNCSNTRKSNFSAEDDASDNEY